MVVGKVFSVIAPEGLVKRIEYKYTDLVPVQFTTDEKMFTENCERLSGKLIEKKDKMICTIDYPDKVRLGFNKKMGFTTSTVWTNKKAESFAVPWTEELKKHYRFITPEK